MSRQKDDDISGVSDICWNIVYLLRSAVMEKCCGESGPFLFMLRVTDH